MSLIFLLNEVEVDLERDMVSRHREDGERAVCVVLVVLREVHRSDCAPKALVQNLIQFLLSKKSMFESLVKISAETPVGNECDIVNDHNIYKNKPIKDGGSTAGLPPCNKPKDQQSN